MLRTLAEQGIRRASAQGDELALVQAALQILYQRKAFREEAGIEEEHYPDGPPRPLHSRVRVRGLRPLPVTDPRDPIRRTALLVRGAG